MKFIPQKIADVFLIEPQVHGDDRGYFMESFRLDKLEKAIGYKVDFIQENESYSTKGVLRGLHFQKPPHEQSKLVRVTKGAVLDVAVDIRPGSPTFGWHVSVELSDENKKQLFIPKGFAHGFVVLSSEAVFCYKVDSHYSPKSDSGLLYNDELLSIDWGDTSQLIVSDKDTNQQGLNEFLKSIESIVA